MPFVTDGKNVKSGTKSVWTDRAALGDGADCRHTLERRKERNNDVWKERNRKERGDAQENTHRVCVCVCMHTHAREEMPCAPEELLSIVGSLRLVFLAWTLLSFPYLSHATWNVTIATTKMSLSANSTCQRRPQFHEILNNPLSAISSGSVTPSIAGGLNAAQLVGFAK